MNVSMLSDEQLKKLLLGESCRPFQQQVAEPACEGPEPSPLTRAQLVKQRLAIARELLIRHEVRTLMGRVQLDSPNAVRDYLRLHFATLDYEVFMIILLDAQHRIIDCCELFRGSLTHISVYPREVVKLALVSGAAALICAHQHPSGQSKPSRADELLTQTLRSALGLIDVRVLDHLVFGGGTFFSFAENGLL